ncbi:MAG: class I SAM-dependent methyltransferase [Hyphomicrobiales bacterium]|nr:class I SAM-dependent methyltransferase [Hyphomicrobiales bacterium]
MRPSAAEESDMPSPQENHAAQRAFWNSDAALRWLRRQEETDAMLAPAESAAIARAAPQPGEHALDIGCGCGASTLALAARVGARGRVVGVDISEPMLERARARSINLPQVETLLADAATWDFPSESFDLMFSRFGVMFFGDPAKAFAHLRGALKPTGRIVFVCWRPFVENPWMAVPYNAATKHVPRPPRPGPEDPGPYSFADAERVTRILSQAGFAAPSFEKFEFLLDIAGGRGVDAAVESAANIGAAAGALKDQPDALRQNALAEMRAALAPHEKDGRVELAGAVWIVEARRA